jgi:hypothetical protein
MEIGMLKFWWLFAFATVRETHFIQNALQHTLISREDYKTILNSLHIIDTELDSAI